jgi:hypothetical protein
MNENNGVASQGEPDWNQLDEWFAAIEKLRESVHAVF